MSQAGGSGWHLDLGVGSDHPCGSGLEWLQPLPFVGIDITGEGVGWS